MIFKEKIVKLREERKLTIETISSSLNISEYDLTSFEEGTLEPTLDQIRLLANFYDITIESLIDDNSDIVKNLKDVNDWGKPFNDEKATALSVSEFENIDRYPIYSVEESVVKTLEDLINYEIEDYYIDDIFLEDATPIFVLREVTNREKHEFGKSYIFHIPEDDSNITYLELSVDIQNWNEEIHNFKITLQGNTANKTGDGSLS